MHTIVRRVLGLGLRGLGVGLIVAASALAAAPPAWSDDDHRGRRHDRRDDRREHERERWRDAQRHEWQRRRELERHRAGAHWRFHHDHGWRYEHRPGVWSPVFVWWWVDGRPSMRPVPTVRMVTYPTGRYELHGDGVSAPYYWLWRPFAVVAAPPPVPVPPPPPPDYAIPSDAYPPPPSPPGG